MDHRFLAGLQQRSAAYDSDAAQGRWATVTAVNPREGLARVLIQPEQVETGWLPVLGLSAGGAFVWSPPSQGDQVYIAPDCGSADAYVVLGSFSRPPQTPDAVDGADTTVQPGEVAVTTPDGVVFRIGAGQVFIKGDLLVDGDVSDRHGSLHRLRQNYDAHKHTGVAIGASLTGTTDHPDPA